MSLPLFNLSPVSTAQTLARGQGIVDLWCCFTDQLPDAELQAAHDALLTAGERERCARFHFERDRRIGVATRALVRTVLSRYAGVAPAAWQFAAGEHGKPHVAHPALDVPLHFNLAHTAGLVVCAVSTAHERLGVDAEALDRAAAGDDIATRYFTAAEVRALQALPAADRPRAFLVQWTLKESYMKARGLGLALPLDQFSFEHGEAAPRVAFDPRLADDPARWRFAVIDAPPRHLIAVGVDSGGAALSLRAARVSSFGAAGSS